MTSPIALPVEGALAALHARELPQKDNLCGCFWGAIVLQAAGLDVDQDAVAAESGTLLPAGDPATFVPPGEASRQDYRLPLPAAPEPGSGGTAAPALARAIERLSEGRLASVPVAGPWSGGSVLRLLEALADAGPATTALANVRTSWFWGSRPRPATLLAYLAGGEVQGPEADWDAGHYVNLAAVVAGRARSLVVVRDSYRSLGWDGHHLQPPEAVARALVRGDGREGGVLCVGPAGAAPELVARLEAGGFELRHWDNGTPERAP